MKFILLSDPHLLLDKPQARTDDAVQAAWDKFAFVYDYAYDEGAKVLIAGDLTDGPRSWQMLPELVNFYKSVGDWSDWHDNKPNTYSVRGQHDTYMRNTGMNHRTMMGVLSAGGFIKELGTSPVVLNQSVALYGGNWGDKFDDPCLEWALYPDLVNILVVHAPIADQSLWEGQNYFNAERFLKANPFNLVLCGDIHRTFAIKVDGRWICNTGPMIRKEASVYNFQHEPCIFVYDTAFPDRLDRVKIPHKPAVEVLNREHIEREEARIKSTMDMSRFVDKIKAARAGQYKATTFEDNLKQLVNASGARQSVIELLEEVTKCKVKIPSQTRIKYTT